MRTVQHRTETDDRKRNKLLTELKRENQQLKRKISRLQKQLVRALDTATEPSPEPDAATAVSDQFKCPSCGDIPQTLNLPTGKLFVCRSCQWRRKDGTQAQVG